MKNIITQSLEQSRSALDSLLGNEDTLASIESAAVILISAFKNGGSVYSCGNGGSMSDAMHFAEELTGRYRKNRAPFSATAISDPGHISCVANDFGYEQVFARYLEGRARSGDVLVAISTSGSSANVVKAAELAKSNEISVISMTGKPDSLLGSIADVDIHTIEFDFADKIQELHIKILHILIELIEREFFPENYT